MSNRKPSLLTPYLDLLGTVTDVEIANRAGCSREYVRQVRKRRLIERHVRNRHAEIAKYASEHGIVEATNHFAVSKTMVYNALKDQGLPIPHRTPARDLFFAQWGHILGVLPDSEVVRQSGVCHQLVFKYRKELGIPAQTAKRGANKLMPAIDWTPERLALLGTATDPQVASMIGCCPTAIYRKRRALGIPPCPKSSLRGHPAEDQREKHGDNLAQEASVPLDEHHGPL
jgi:hypothetical protein